MYDIEGSGNMPVWMNMTTAIMVFSFVTMMLVILLVAGVFDKEQGNFQNMPDYGIGQRGDVIAAVPSYEEQSLRQKVDKWSKGGKSQLTGTRDVPVFFQDYDVEMGRKGDTGAVSTAREGFEGGRADEELERALAGRN